MTWHGARRSLLVYSASALIGAFVWVPAIALSWLGVADAFTIWNVAGYPAMLVAAFLLCRWHAVSAVLLALIMNTATYLVPLKFVPHTGNLLPFEILMMIVLVIPLAIAARLGGRHSRASKH